MPSPHETPTALMPASRHARTRDVVISEFILPPAFRVPAHDHTPPHVLVMLGGSLSEKHGDADELCATGSIRYSPGGDTHTDIRTGGAGAHCLIVEARAFPELRLLNRAYVPAADAATDVSALAQCLRHAPCASPGRIEALSLSLFSLIRVRARPSHSVHHQWVSRIGPFLDGLTCSATPLTDAAHHVGHNPSIVARLFRAAYGVSVQRYFGRRQLDQAWQLLVNSDSPLSAIAADCGFTDQSHMTRAFTRDAKVSPAQLRVRVRSGAPDAGHWYRSIPLKSHF